MIMDERTGRLHDFTRKRGVVHAEILAAAGSPSWVLDRSELWNRVELTEKRKDSQLCREINVALPHELNKQQRLELIRDFVERTFVSAGMVADLCLHAPNKGDDPRNHHAHIMLTMRMVDGDGFGPKERNWNAVELLEQWREKWADAANAALEKAGHDARIDHRSHADRGIDTFPGQHRGPAVSGILARGGHSDVAERMEGERAAHEAAQLAAQIAIAQAQAGAAAAELAAAEAEEAAWADAAQAIADAAAAAADQQARQQRAEAERVAAAANAAEERRKHAQELADARQRHAAAAQVLAQAVKAEGRAGQLVDDLRPEWSDALDEQRIAGTSLLKTALAVPKMGAWTRAIQLYEDAVDALKSAQAAVQRARQVVAQAWSQVLGLDPVERGRQAPAQAAQMEAQAQREREQREALAKRQAERFKGVDDYRRGPDRPKDAPLYEHSRQSDQDRERGG
jgi:ATP-dependent exoDNAse (exonuclease V) alpha subunit